MAVVIKGSGTVEGVSVGGLPDGIVDADTLASNAVSTVKVADDAVTAAKIGAKAFVSYALIFDQKSQDTAGGEFANGGWRQRDLNTEGYDPDGIVSISSNDFTLAAGNYLIKWSAPAYRVNRHMARLYDVTGTTTITPYGSSEHSGSSDYTATSSIGSARVTPTGSNTYRIYHRCETTKATDGFGNYAGHDVEMYTRVEIYKEA